MSEKEHQIFAGALLSECINNLNDVPVGHSGRYGMIPEVTVLSTRLVFGGAWKNRLRSISNRIWTMLASARSFTAIAAARAHLGWWCSSQKEHPTQKPFPCRSLGRIGKGMKCSA